MNLLVVDLDGTLCNDAWRKRCLPDYEEYHSGIPGDEPHQGVLMLIGQYLLSTDSHVAIMTSRPERYRQATLDWLSETCFIDEDDFLFVAMREEGQKGSSPQLKMAMIAELTKPGGAIADIYGNENWVVSTLFLEDRDDVCAAYSAAGYAFIKV